MMSFQRLFFFSLFSVLLIASLAKDAKNEVSLNSPFWPEPQFQSHSADDANPLVLSTDFQFSSKVSFQSDVLDKAMERYAQLLKPEADAGQDGEVSLCLITLTGTEEESSRSSFVNGVDESYTLQTNNETCAIQAVTIWGAINGMETFTQIFKRKTDGIVSSIFINNVNITDYNRFQHRGILIDTSRHYLPVNEITRMIDAAKMSKFNVLHVHLVDAQSFPFNSVSSPEIVKGAYSPNYQYSTDDIQYITDYAYYRGIRIVYEIDVPGHAASWGAGYPEVVADCVDKYDNINNIALNPTLDKTYEVLNGILSDISKYSGKSPYIHIGK